MLIKINAIVREEKFEDVKEALNKIGVNGITVSQVMGCGAQKGFTEVIRGTKVDMMMRPKIKFEIVVSSEEWERKTIEAIQKSAFTGEVLIRSRISMICFGSRPTVGSSRMITSGYPINAWARPVLCL